MGVELKINQNTSYLSVYKVVVKKKNMIHQLGGGGGGTYPSSVFTTTLRVLQVPTSTFVLRHDLCQNQLLIEKVKLCFEL